MAKEEANEEAEAPADGGKKKLIILIVVLLLLVALSVGGTIVALKMFSGAEDEMLEAELIEEEVEEDMSQSPAIYYPLKPPIIVNFESRGRQRFLQAELTLMMRDENVVQTIEIHMPMIRNALVLMFSGQVYEDVQTAEGKDQLREQALEEIQKLMEQEIGKPGIEQVLFTNFVMQ